MLYMKIELIKYILKGLSTVLRVTPNKTNHQPDQMKIVIPWIKKAIQTKESNNKDEILIFSSLYSALNSISWC